MVLPIPVKLRSREDAVRFINLKKYPNFFDDLENGFQVPVSAGALSARATSPSTKGLAVQVVGNFQASFVPTVSDFSRLDKRFRLPDGMWDKLPQYKNYGFAIFKLKPGAQTVHPMAFSFPRGNTKELFFPTVHIHDGQVHPKADFDHLLYCQRNSGEGFRLSNWRESPQLAKNFIDAAKSQNIVESTQHCYRTELRGKLQNADTILT